MDYRALIKSKVRESARISLEITKASHSKTNMITWTILSITNTQSSILFALQSHCVRGIRENFKQLYSQNTLCPVCERCRDRQSQFFNVKYSKIFSHCLILEETDHQVSLPVIYAGPKQHQARRPLDQSCTRDTPWTNVSLDGIK